MKQKNINTNEVFSEKRNCVLLTIHQICTPLTAIKGYISLIQEGNFGKISSEIQDILQIVQKSTDRLVDTVHEAISK